MGVYNKTELEQTLLLEEALNLKEGGFINTEQYRWIEGQLTGVKTQKSILIRLGLFLVGLILCSSICGVISLFSFTMMSMNGFGFVSFATALTLVIALEWMIRANKYFGYGLDDAFLIGSQLALIALVFSGLDAMNISDVWMVWLGIVGTAIITTFFAIRYLNVLATLTACMSVTAAAGYWLIEENIGIAAVFMMFFALLLSVGFQYLKKKSTDVFYLRNIQWGIYYSLVLFYLTGNLWVMSHFAYYFEEEMNTTTGIQQLWMCFYWIFMFAVPVWYLFLSIKKRDKGWLWIGIVTLFFSFYTLNQLVYFIAGEWLLTIGGAVLFGLSFWAIKKLRNAESGLTFKADRLNDDSAFVDAEALLVMAQLGIKPETTAEAPMKFGGGGFSGGGAGGSF